MSPSSSNEIAPSVGISLILPCWRDVDEAIRIATEWHNHPAIKEVILAGVTGEYPDDLVFPPSVHWRETAEPSRGAQMNNGAKLASGDVLLFHHVDSSLTDRHLAAIAPALLDEKIVGGAFYRRFDSRHPGLQWLERWERTHCKLFGAIYGDQSVFVRREHFKFIGGFADIPLMEDVDFSRRLRRSGKVVLLDPPMESSPHKQIAHGSWRVSLRNLSYLILFRLGANARTLHRRYYKAMNSKTASHWQTRWRAFRRPIDPEKERILRERWNSLPTELQTPNQISGRHLTHCGFITGPSYCSFHCTHCYLPKNANQVPIPSLAEVKEQIDANRRFQGPGGGLQITGGDVADAYWKSGRADELIEIIQYAYRAGVVPMLMTHGQTLIEQPQYFKRLVVEGGLRQVSVHVDATQAGRHGFPIGRVKSEADLHPVRQAFTNLARQIRAETGAPVEYALSFTVTRKNIEDVPDVIRWYLADPERTRIWRMLSFQPEADTGRTIFSAVPITPDLVWEKICEGVGFAVDREGTIFGHPHCNSWASILVSRRTGKFMPLLPTDQRTREILGEILAKFGGLSLVTDDARTAPFRLAGILAKNPTLFARAVLHIGRLLLTGAMPAGMAIDLFRGNAHTLGVGMHNFMDASQVAKADHDPVTKSRLDSCVFKGAVKEEGEWKAVPMCQMNQQKWAAVYDERLQNPALLSEGQVFERAPEVALVD